MRLEREVEEGRAAFRSGVPRDANPYPWPNFEDLDFLSDHPASAWAEGWEEAEAEVAAHDLPPCVGCSSCCFGLAVRLSVGDNVPRRLMVRYGDSSRRPMKGWREDGDAPLPLWADGEFYMRQRKDGSCMALDRKNRRCTIYDRRPQVCRGFLRGGTQCLAVAAAPRCKPSAHSFAHL